MNYVTPIFRAIGSSASSVDKAVSVFGNFEKISTIIIHCAIIAGNNVNSSFNTSQTGEFIHGTNISSEGIENAPKVTPYWILYNGSQVNIYKGKYGDISHLYLSYAGTSGAEGFQSAALQDDADEGPIPEGDYKINLALSPRRFSQIDPTGQTDQSDGVERVINGDGSRNNLMWGRWRARLNRENSTSPRGNFYLHDSYKGYSHGCIETETIVYYFLLYLSDAGYSAIKVKVQYSKPNLSTNGGTKNLKLTLPLNVLPDLKSQEFPRKPGKDYPFIPIPKYPYIFTPKSKTFGK